MKQAIRAVLNKYANHIYVHMPVPVGYGRPSLDYLCFVCGRGLAIEAKREGGRPTLRQQGAIEEMERAGAKVFIVNSYQKLQELEQWIVLQVGEKEQPRVRNQ